jgi:hypothetical protein
MAFGVRQFRLRLELDRRHDTVAAGPFSAPFFAVEQIVAWSRQTQSRITLYTGNTYFKWPDLHWPGTFRPFAEYATHLDVLMIYTLDTTATERVTDLEVLVQEPWRIASRQRSSTTREYIGAVQNLEDLREGRGEFDTAKAFYKFWRAFPFKVSPQVQRQLNQLLQRQAGELDALRKAMTAHPEASDQEEP